MRRGTRPLSGAAALLAGLWVLGAQAAAKTVTTHLGDFEVPDQEEPPPPPWKAPAYPVLTIRPECRAPVIDGAVDLDEEWRDACILSGFYQKDLNGIAPPEGQIQFLIKVDAENLYAAMRSPIYPPGAQLRAFEKRRDAYDEIMAGDHMVIEVLPARVRTERVVRSTGFFTLAWNTLGTLADLHVAHRPGMLGPEWVSNAELADRVTPEMWESEIRVPLKSFANAGMEKYLELPPAGGQYWSLGFARRFGKTGSNLFTTWENDGLVMQKDYGEQVAVWSHKGMLRFDEDGVVVQLRDLGDLTQGRLDADLRFYNPHAEAHEVTAEIFVQRSNGEQIWAAQAHCRVPPGGQVAAEGLQAALDLEPRGSRLYLKVVQDGEKLLYITPGQVLLRFDESLRGQYARSLEVLRQM